MNASLWASVESMRDEGCLKSENISLQRSSLVRVEASFVPSDKCTQRSTNNTTFLPLTSDGQVIPSNEYINRFKVSYLLECKWHYVILVVIFFSILLRINYILAEGPHQSDLLWLIGECRQKLRLQTGQMFFYSILFTSDQRLKWGKR